MSCDCGVNWEEEFRRLIETDVEDVEEGIDVTEEFDMPVPVRRLEEAEVE